MGKLVAVIGSGLWALMSVSQVQALDPAGFRMGNFGFAPTFGYEVIHDDNIFTDAAGEESSRISVINPGLKGKADFGTVDLGIDYQLLAGRYANSGNDDYDDHTLATDLTWELNHRNQFDLEAIFNKGHEDRGSEGTSVNAVSAPDEFDESNVNGKYTYGSETSKGRLELRSGSLDREFTNNRATTTDNDRQDVNVGAILYWRVGGRTDVLFEVATVDVDYDDATVTLDSTADTVNLGFAWKATGKTQGIVKVGQTKKDFDNSTLTDSTLDSWEVEMKYSPKSYSVFSLGTARKIRETSSIGNFINVKAYNLGWENGWSDRFRSNFYATLDQEAYEGTVREDDVSTYGMRFDYNIRHWLEVGFSTVYTNSESTDALSEYEKTQVGLHVLMGL